MQVLCMKGTVAQWFSRRATDLQLHVHLSCQTKQHEMNAVKTFDMAYVLPVSSKGNHSLRVHCCILGYKLGTHHSEINFKCSILQNNKIMCLIYCANICYLSAKRLKERDH